MIRVGFAFTAETAADVHQAAKSVETTASAWVAAIEANLSFTMAVEISG